MKKAVIIGGGLSGLAAARAIEDAAKAKSLPVEVTVVERDGGVGGKIRSVRVDGYLCEEGPNGFLDNKPSTMALSGRIGMQDRLLKSNDDARKRYVFSGGQLQRLPEDPVAFLTSELISIRGKLRIASEFFLPQGDGKTDETVAEFVRRRLGQEALDKLIDPMSAGVYAGDPSVMSIKSSFPKVAVIEQQFGGLLKGMLAMQQMAKARGQSGPASAGPGGALWSYVDGAAELPKKLAADLGDRVRVNSAAKSLAKDGAGWKVRLENGSELAADAVVLATPAYDAAALLGPHDAALADLLHAIPYVPTAVVCVGYARGDVAMPLDGFGFLIPTKEKRRILGALWSSSIFKHRAPDGKVLFTLIVGGARNPEMVALPDDELLAVCRAEVGITMNIPAEPKFTRIVRWERAIPQYVRGHADRVARAEGIVRGLGNLWLGGNAYYGIGINDCTARAEVLGPQVAAALAGAGG